MSRRLTEMLLPLAVVACVGLAAGCGDDDGNGGTDPPPPVDLSGTYVLGSLTQGGQPCPVPIPCHGTMTLTQTRYDVDLTVPDPVTQLPVQTLDSGEYSIDGNNWTQQSDGQLPASIGTFTFQGGTLTVMVTSPLEVTTVWNKTG